MYWVVMRALKPGELRVYNVGVGKGWNSKQFKSSPTSACWLTHTHTHTHYFCIFSSFFHNKHTHTHTHTHTYALFAGYSVREFIAACQSVTGKNISVEEKPARPGDPPVIFADSSKILEELGWTPKHTNLHESLKTAWAWQQKHPNGYDEHL